jgi:hypothetical protein
VSGLAARDRQRQVKEAPALRLRKRADALGRAFEHINRFTRDSVPRRGQVAGAVEESIPWPEVAQPCGVSADSLLAAELDFFEDGASVGRGLRIQPHAPLARRLFPIRYPQRAGH